MELFFDIDELKEEIEDALLVIARAAAAGKVQAFRGPRLNYYVPQHPPMLNKYGRRSFPLFPEARLPSKVRVEISHLPANDPPADHISVSRLTVGTSEGLPVWEYLGSMTLPEWWKDIAIPDKEETEEAVDDLLFLAANRDALQYLGKFPQMIKWDLDGQFVETYVAERVLADKKMEEGFFQFIKVYASAKHKEGAVLIRREARRYSWQEVRSLHRFAQRIAHPKSKHVAEQHIAR